MTYRNAISALALLGLAACPDDGSGGFAGEIEFAGRQDFLPGFEQDTGFLPADSPAALRVVARASGGVDVAVRATTDGSSLTPVAQSGSLETSGGLTVEVSARINASGFDYEGEVGSFEYTIEPGETNFDPFLLEGEATVESSLPATELARVPVPSLPGATVIVEVTGGTVTTRYSGTCAEAADGVGQVQGRTTTSGTVDVAGTVELEIPIIGTETFGPFPFALDIPETSSDIDLGARSLQTGEPVEDASVCSGVSSGTDSGATEGSGDGSSGTSGGTTSTTTTADPSTTSTTDMSTTTSTTTGETEGMTTGSMCMDVGLEPNDGPMLAEFQMRDPPYSCDGYSIMMAGTLDGPNDEDWFEIESLDTDANGCDHLANIDIPDARACIFADCAVGDMPATMCVEGTFEVSPTGLPGCCSNVGPGSLQIECSPNSGTLISAYVRVDQGMTCDNYNAVYQHDPS